MAVIRLVPIRAAREEEVLVNLLSVLLELVLKDAVSFVTLLSLEHMGDFSAVDGGDKCYDP